MLVVILGTYMDGTETRILKDRGRPGPTVALTATVLSAAWMGAASGGYFVRDWALVVFVLTAAVAVVALVGFFRVPGSRWGVVALGLFTGYAAWTCVSLLWSPNRGDAWFGSGQTLLYLLVFGATASLIALGASRRWALIASVLGPTTVAAYTLATLVGEVDTVFKDNRLVGTVGYYNGEAAFLLVPFWVAVYLAGARRINPFLRGLVLAGAVLCVEIAVLTQSRGALVAMAVSLPIFFVFSGQRLRGLLALIPVAASLLVSFPGLNAVYLAFLNGGDPAATLDRIVPTVWATSGAAGLYGLLWGGADRLWRPSAGVVRVARAAATLALVAALVVGAAAQGERMGSPVAWAEEKWEAFKTDDSIGQEQSRYLSASGSGRYALWQVAWRDFASHPLLGVGTHNYEATYYQLREQEVGYVRQPHNLPLEVVGERGLVGGALFFGFLSVCLAAGLWRRFGRLNPEDKALVGTTIAASTYWLVHSTAEWFWQLPAVTLPAIIYLAVLASPSCRTEAEPPGWPLRIGVTAGAVLMVTVVAPLYVADRYLTQSYVITNPWVALEKVERARRFDPANPQLPQREAELAMQIGNWPRVEMAYGDAIRLNPTHYAPYTLLGKFREQRGEREEALSSYREALALNPLDRELIQSVTRLEEERY